MAPDDLYRGLEHLVAHTVPNHDVVVVELSARNNTDKVVNPFGRGLLSMCVTRDMVIANGRTLGDALGCCTFFADNGEGCSNVDLAVVIIIIIIEGFGRDLLSMCVTRDMVIANGRTQGDASGCCTFFAVCRRHLTCPEGLANCLMTSGVT